MKIRCENCPNEASVFCVADEAALCTDCDRRVHSANKLAAQHKRFRLHHPSSKQEDLICDICQEMKAYLFCQEDRAILCRECDMRIHKANEYTRKHNRYLVTGIKFSNDPATAIAAAVPESRKSTSSVIMKNTVTDDSNVVSVPNDDEDNNFVLVKYSAAGQTPDGGGVLAAGGGGGDYNNNSNVPSTGSSNISEHIEKIPGLGFEEFLDLISPSPFGFCKSTCGGAGAGTGTGAGTYWIPNFLKENQNLGAQEIQMHDPSSSFYYKSGDVVTIQDLNSRRMWNYEDNCFSVPEININNNPSYSATIKRQKNY